MLEVKGFAGKLLLLLPLQWRHIKVAAQAVILWPEVGNLGTEAYPVNLEGRVDRLLRLSRVQVRLVEGVVQGLKHGADHELLLKSSLPWQWWRGKASATL